MDVVTIIQLCENSELILVTIPVKSDTGVFNRDYQEVRTILKVISVLKGDPKIKAISNFHSPFISCPPPPNYPIGDTILTFIVKEPSGNRYITYAEAYGTKRLTGKHYYGCIEKINDLLTIMNKSDDDLENPLIVEWLVKTLKNPILKWDCARLLRFGDYEYNDYQFVIRHYGELLSEKQRLEIYDFILDRNEIDISELWLIEIVDDLNDYRLLPLLLEYLDKHTKYHLTMATDVMTWICEIKGGKAGLKLIEEYKKEIKKIPADRDILEVIRRFKILMQSQD
ncbi:MAG: hypothetical protein GY839_20445 [candidate division Zixibacteria bacterium]|nr:hypothetical protein [candidate division Zixibacteria bacterium]